MAQKQFVDLFWKHYKQDYFFVISKIYIEKQAFIWAVHDYRSLLAGLANK
jgi:hypothetical protein